MFEKVNPAHPDKVADRIAGALVDYAYAQSTAPKIAVEVLIGHGTCTVIAETSVHIPQDFVIQTVARIASVYTRVTFVEVPQDKHLSNNQRDSIRCGDNGIFKGMPITCEQRALSDFARRLYKYFPTDGKFVLANNELYLCQSNATVDQLSEVCRDDIMYTETAKTKVNPLGFWTGGVYVDSGATNRKLGSDMGDSVTGGGLHGKDLSKADVSVNIYAFLKAQECNAPVTLACAIGDESVDGRPYAEIVEIARDYINRLGGFEKFAEWGLI